MNPEDIEIEPTFVQDTYLMWNATTHHFEEVTDATWRQYAAGQHETIHKREREILRLAEKLRKTRKRVKRLRRRYTKTYSTPLRRALKRVLKGARL